MDVFHYSISHHILLRAKTKNSNLKHVDFPVALKEGSSEYDTRFSKPVVTKTDGSTFHGNKQEAEIEELSHFSGNGFVRVTFVHAEDAKQLMDANCGHQKVEITKEQTYDTDGAVKEITCDKIKVTFTAPKKVRSAMSLITHWISCVRVTL